MRGVMFRVHLSMHSVLCLLALIFALLCIADGSKEQCAAVPLVHLSRMASSLSTAAVASPHVPTVNSWWEHVIYQMHKKTLKHWQGLQLFDKAGLATECQLKFWFAEGKLEDMRIYTQSTPQTEKEARSRILAKFFQQLHIPQDSEKHIFDWEHLTNTPRSQEDGWRLCMEALMEACDVQHLSELKLPGYSSIAFLRREDLDLVYDLNWHKKGDWKEKTAMRLFADERGFWMTIIGKMFPELANFMNTMKYRPDMIPPRVPADFFYTMGEELSERFRNRLLAHWFASRSLNELRPLSIDLHKHITVVDGHLVVVRDLINCGFLDRPSQI